MQEVIECCSEVVPQCSDYCVHLVESKEHNSHEDRLCSCIVFIFQNSRLRKRQDDFPTPFEVLREMRPDRITFLSFAFEYCKFRKWGQNGSDYLK